MKKFFARTQRLGELAKQFSRDSFATQRHCWMPPALLVLIATYTGAWAQPLTTAGQPAQLDVREAGSNSVRLTLKPARMEEDFLYTPVLNDIANPAPVLQLRRLNGPITRSAGTLQLSVRADPLTVKIHNIDGELIQEVAFRPDGTLTFLLDDQPVFGLGEGGPRPGPEIDWRSRPVEFDRRGRFYRMEPRWQRGAYGSRNPVALLIGTSGWGLFVAMPWGQIDLSRDDHGMFIPVEPAEPDSMQQSKENQHENLGKGIPPFDSFVPGYFDLFVFDAHDPAAFMRELATLTGSAALPPKWALGYMQSHRTLEDDTQLIDIVDTFREKQIPLDAVIYLGTGFTPRGWNTEQPSFDFNPEVFKRDPAQVIAELHERHVKVVLHMVPWDRDRLPTLHGSIPPKPGEQLDDGHIASYWQQHIGLVNAGVDAWWPDEGDWFNLFERLKRHQMYYQGPVSTEPDVRPWSLHRNGHLGVARWGGWIWSGDTDSAWKSLEAQIAVGLNHSLSISPFWGSDIGGFFPSEELTGELYVRWFQFGAFTPSFRSHGQTWWTRLPWGWGKSDLGPRESRTPPSETALNNPAIEPIARRYAELRYQLLPYTYTLAWQARHTGMPMMCALWLYYPNDAYASSLGNEYLWGRDLLVAPVFEPAATSRDVYLPEGKWYDWWTDKKYIGGRTISRSVDLATMPIFVRAGAIIPFDPVRQHTDQPVDSPTTLKVYRGADGAFTMYDDDGVSLGYLDGEATWIQMRWDNAAQTLTLESGAPDGLPGLPCERTFSVELLPEGTTRIAEYTGQRIQVKFRQ